MGFQIKKAALVYNTNHNHTGKSTQTETVMEGAHTQGANIANATTEASKMTANNGLMAIKDSESVCSEDIKSVSSKEV
jgi:hypothetical protein